jgi:hypothetical protein
MQRIEPRVDQEVGVVLLNVIAREDYAGIRRTNLTNENQDLVSLEYWGLVVPSYRPGEAGKTQNGRKVNVASMSLA